MNPSAANYNPEANQDDGSCTFGLINNQNNNSTLMQTNTAYSGGCTDSTACNYSKDAVYNDNSCKYSDPSGECDGKGYIDKCGI